MPKRIGSTLIVVLAACAGQESGAGAAESRSEPAVPLESTGGEMGSGEGSAAAPAEEPAPQGPTQLTVDLVIDDEKVPGDVQVLDAQGEVVEEGSSGDTFSVPAGQYELVGQINDASLLVDKPSKESGPIRIEGGGERKEVVEFGRAKVLLKIFKGRRRIRNATVALRPEGAEEVIYEFKPGKDHIHISPGRYDARVTFGNTEVEVDGLIFQPAATQSIPVRVQ